MKKNISIGLLACALILSYQSISSHKTLTEPIEVSAKNPFNSGQLMAEATENEEKAQIQLEKAEKTLARQSEMDHFDQKLSQPKKEQKTLTQQQKIDRFEDELNQIKGELAYIKEQKTLTQQQKIDRFEDELNQIKSELAYITENKSVAPTSFR